jgi:hypothetical protein
VFGSEGERSSKCNFDRMYIDRYQW